MSALASAWVPPTRVRARREKTPREPGTTRCVARERRDAVGAGGWAGKSSPSEERESTSTSTRARWIVRPSRRAAAAAAAAAARARRRHRRLPSPPSASFVPDESTDDELPAARSCVYSDKFVYNSCDGDGVAHGDEGNELEAALLITGTAVGGGSLALPYFTAAGGFLPALGLLGVAYALLLGSSVVLVEPTIRVWEDNPDRAVSMHTVVDTYLGERWGWAAGVTFWILINCTLVSQLAQCGNMTTLFLPFADGAAWQRFGSVFAAFVIAGASFRKYVGKINAFATAGLFAAFAAACVAGAPGISVGTLLTANATAAIPALPAIMQTMTYGEAIPTVVDMCRGSRTKVKKVLAFGSLGPAVMYALWLAVTLGRKELAAFGATGGDLAGKILSEGGWLGAATGAIGAFASVSTLIGCYLALSRFNADTFELPLNEGCRKLIALTVLPSLALAVMGGPGLYFLMIKFAGTVPVAFLWGVMPPLVAWTMLRGDGKLTPAWRAVLGAGFLGSVIAMVIGIRTM